MKTSYLIVLFSGFWLLNTQGQAAPSSTTATPDSTGTLRDTPYAVVDQGANHRVWQRTTYETTPSGKTIPHFHKYTELATGLCYQQNGQWVDSKEEINILPNGTAAAIQGQHQAYFPGDIYQGVVELVTPDGIHLQSRPLGLSYDDGTKTVLIAELKDSVGQLVGSNQVIYPNAFTDFKADLRYTYTKAGFEQDIVLREQPPAPEIYGLNPQATRLQVFTELFNAPEPTKTRQAANRQNSLEDTTLAFGTMKMVRGKAFSIGDQAQTRIRSKGIPVAKSWQHLSGRTFLVEELPVQKIEPQLEQLPVPAIANTTMNLQNSIRHKVSAVRLLPPTRLVQTGANTMQLAKTDIQPKQGVVLDYMMINSSQSDCTFQGDTTYLLTGDFGADSIAIEGGAVIKFADTVVNGIEINYDIPTFQTGPYRPAIFTSKNDDSVGEKIDGSTGEPTILTNVTYLNGPSIIYQYLYFRYAGIGLYLSDPSSVKNCQFVKCQNAINIPDGEVDLYNCLFSECDVCVFYDNTWYPESSMALTAENVTADKGTYFWSENDTHDTWNFTIKNCLFSRFTHPTLQYLGYFVDGNSEYDASYDQADASCYLSVGAANYYLTNNSPYRNAGTINIDPALLAELQQKTTYPPMVCSNQAIYNSLSLSPQVPRDTNALPDIGYHYDSLDYVFGGVDFFYWGVSVAPGTAVGWFGNVGSVGSQPYGLSLSDGTAANFNGLATAPCIFVNYNTVQEGGNTNWTQEGSLGGILFNGDTWNPPTLSAQFTKWYELPNDGDHFQDNGSYGVANLNNCEFYGGTIYSTWSPYYFTNCLFQRVNVKLDSSVDGASGLFQNCTFWNGSLDLSRFAGQAASWTILDTTFDGTTNIINDGLNGDTNYTFIDYNAFLTNADWTQGSHDVSVTNFNWQTSWLGNFYLPPDSWLIDMGNTNANLLGLYHFTTQTNQVKEGNSIVDIGYHYVAVDANGNPFDTEVGGIPDYIEDNNGDGVYNYNNWVWPTLKVVEGDGQSGPLNTYLPQPLVVRVIDGYSGDFLPNAPLTFSINNGLNQLVALSGSTLASNLFLITDANGLAGVYLFLPTNAPVINIVAVTAQDGYNSAELDFTCTEGQIATPDIEPPGGTFTTIQYVTISCATTNATIHYTLNGNDPTETDSIATNGQSIGVPWTMTVKAAAFEDGILLPSGVGTADFAIIHPLVAGRKHTLVLKPDGTMLAGGSGGNGQIGDGTTHLRTNLVSVLGVSNVVGIAAGELFSYAWSSDGTAWALAWGDDREGEMGNGTVTHRQTNAIPITNLTAVIGMSAGNHHGLAVDTNGLVWAWGLNNYGQLGTNIMVCSRLNPMPVTNLAGVVAVAAGSYHSLAIKTNGTVWGWGRARQGELGDGTTPPLRTIPVQAAGLTNVSAIAAGKDFSLAISNGVVWQWGTIEQPYPYNGPLFQSSTPTKVTMIGLGGPPLTNIVAIAAGWYHVLALKSDGTVWSWGFDGHDQLGIGSHKSWACQVIGLSNVVAIAAGGEHSAALKSDGTIVLWGYLNYGQELYYSQRPTTPDPDVKVDWVPPAITMQPLSQEVLEGDTVTFSVGATGANLTYQWNFNGNPIPGATASSYTINYVQGYDAGQGNNAGSYNVIVANGMDSVVSSNATLTVYEGTGDPLLITVGGQRQDYTFKSGVTYYITSPVQLYGNTTIEGGAVLKFWYYYSTLQVMGSLTCKTEQYYPAILTLIDDDASGEIVWWISDGYPQTVENGMPYLDLSATSSNSIHNLRICFADKGVTTPSGRLDAWDCQFVACNTATVASQGATDSLHNVLFAGCGTAVGAMTNFNEIDAEQVTADVSNFWSAPSAPLRINLTNSIIFGTLGSGPAVSSQNVALDPSGTVFQTLDYANYYLATNTYRQAGTINISPQLLAELPGKTTCPPVAFAPLMQISGDITLFPQVPRYTSGAPDLGYYYAALDYTVGGFTLLGGSITVEPGTVIAVANDCLPAYGDSFTIEGFDLQEGSSFVSHGTPNKPNIFTAEKMVQETPETEFSWFQVYYGYWYGTMTFIPDFAPNNNNLPAPVLDFRFSKFYLPPNDYHICSGMDEYYCFEPSLDSCVYLYLRDCTMRGGRINLGIPDGGYPDYVYGSGAVLWTNNTFDNVTINLDPTYYEYGYGVNCDIQVQAYNNLFRGGLWFHLEPILASAGNWTLQDNLFDKVNFVQDLNTDPNQPLDYDYNGYWPLSAAELAADWNYMYYNPNYMFDITWVDWFLANTNQLQPTTTDDGFTDGGHEVVLTTAPPYQAGPFGNFYLPTNTPLYGAGSDTPANLGLYHYTTRLDQMKEGNDTAKANANIGVHYIAATNYQPSTLTYQPIDTDGDGIPDYVENWHGDGDYPSHTDTETDWQNAMTDGVTPDAYNTNYDDIDLDGDGLTGRAERILGANPLIPDNPLTLTPVITGQEPYILTYSMPLSIDVDSNQCVLGLMDNGVDAGVYAFTQQTNGTYLMQWNTTFANNGSHTLQVELFMPGASLPLNDTADVQHVNNIFGPTRFENVNNILQLDPDNSFGSQAEISGTLQVSSADYEIDIYDTNNVLLKTITNHTDYGTLDEIWNLIADGGETRSDPEFNVQIYVTPTGVSGNLRSSLSMRANAANNQNGNTGPITFHLITSGGCGDDFTMAYGWNNNSYGSSREQMIQWDVVNVLFDPGADAPYQDAFPFLNAFDAYCFFMGTTNNVETLLNQLSRFEVGNFFWFGHGSGCSISSASSAEDQNQGYSFLYDTQIGKRLGNNWFGKANGTWTSRQHPYRLVILDGCATATEPFLAEAFGIEGKPHSEQWFEGRGESPQAFVGWETLIDVPGDWWAHGIPPTYQYDSYGYSLEVLFSSWMNEYSLRDCLAAAADRNLAFPLGPHYKIFGDSNLTRLPEFEP